MVRRNKKEYVDEDVLTLAYERCEHMFNTFDTVSVMFSGGKDSTATLKVALEVAERMGKLPLDVVFFDEEAIPLQTVEYVARVGHNEQVRLRWLCLPLKHRNACSRKQPYWYPWGPEDADKWVRPFPVDGIETVPGYPAEIEHRMPHYDLNGLLYPPKEYGNVGLMLGIRAQESMNRHRMVTAKGDENWLVVDHGATDLGNVTKGYPIFDWTTEDVWTAPGKMGWDYNRAYDVMEQAGLSRNQQRCSPAYGEEPLEKLWTYSVCFPEIWDKMLDRVHGAKTAARYATTELYAYGKRPDKPDGVTWREYLLHYIEMFPEKERADLAARIRDATKNHFSKVKDPILDETPHPVTGLSYNFLQMLAMRGDFKGRKQAGGNIKMEPAQREAAWKKYDAEFLKTYGVPRV